MLQSEFCFQLNKIDDFILEIVLTLGELGWKNQATFVPWFKSENQIVEKNNINQIETFLSFIRIILKNKNKKKHSK